MKNIVIFSLRIILQISFKTEIVPKKTKILSGWWHNTTVLSGFTLCGVLGGYTCVYMVGEGLAIK